MASDIQYQEVERVYTLVIEDAKRVKLASLKCEPWASVETARVCLDDSIVEFETLFHEAMEAGRTFLVRRMMILRDQAADLLREALEAIRAAKGDA